MNFNPNQAVLVKSKHVKGIVKVVDESNQKAKVTYHNKNKDNQRFTEWFTFDQLTEWKPKQKVENKQHKPLEIKIKYFDPDMPKLQEIKIGDLIDLRTREEIVLIAGEFKIIPLGVAMEIPSGWKADILPRSSTFKTWGIIQTNSVGKVDNSFSGNNDEWGMPVYATKDMVIEKYSRVCQFELTRKMPKVNFNEVDELKNPSRSGFGSTGTK